MRHYAMRAHDSVTNDPYVWISSGSPDFAGTSYPGPNDPELIVCLSAYEDGVSNFDGKLGSSPWASTGLLRVGAGASASPIALLYGLKSDGTTTVALVRWGANANNRFTIGDSATGALDSFEIGGFFFSWTFSSSLSHFTSDIHRFTAGGQTRLEVDSQGAKINGVRAVMPSEGATLNNADQTITADQGAQRAIPTITANRVYDLDNTNSIDEEFVYIYCTSSLSFTATVRDHANATIAVFPVGEKLVGSFQKAAGANFEFRGFTRIV